MDVSRILRITKFQQIPVIFSKTGSLKRLIELKRNSISQTIKTSNLRYKLKKNTHTFLFLIFICQEEKFRPWLGYLN